jgi:NNP family nitrate/nitrite transporter-like MFS transporter
MAFMAGWATDRLGTKRVMATVFLLTGTTTIFLAAAHGYWLVITVFLQPMLAVCFFPAGFAALSCIGPASSRNVAISLTIPFAFLIGGGAIPTGIGIMGDISSFSLGLILVGAIILLGFVLSLILNLPEENECQAALPQD